MSVGPPQLGAEWIPQPFGHSSSRGSALVEAVATEHLTWDDLWRIRHAADSRVVRARRDHETLEREIVVLRELVAGIKVQKHEVEAQLSRLKEEAAAMRAALGSEDKQATRETRKREDGK